MAFTRGSGVFVFNTLLTIISAINAQDIPSVTLQAFKPKGFRAYINDTQHISLFVFHGNINKPIKSSDVGTLSGETHRATNGKWIFEDRELQLKVGDVINYHVFVSLETAGYINVNLNYLKDHLSYTITELEEQMPPPFTETSSTDSEPSKCKDTLTTILGGRTACAGQTIFEDNFDTLNESFWKIEHYIPIHHNEIPFVSYQRLSNNPTVTVMHGNLRISPTLQQNLSGYNEESITSGTLDLTSGCTAEADACYRKAVGADILPPIVSGRVTSKSFAFRYGTIYVRAKLPIGDWLYPEILLEPFQKNRYGSKRHASGVIKIACSFGNKDLNTSTHIYGGRLLYGGPVMDSTCLATLANYNLLPQGKLWGDEFHVYSLRWDPDRIVLSVDGKEWWRVEPSASGLVGMFPKHCTNVNRNVLGPKLAPFNDFFYITLGVVAGGITEFPERSTSGVDKPKPWKNSGRKAMLTFWQDLHNWYPTWDEPELLVDYVRVVAL